MIDDGTLGLLLFVAFFAFVGIVTWIAAKHPGDRP